MKERTPGHEFTDRLSIDSHLPLDGLEARSLASRILAVVTHEVKTPLDSLYVNFQILRKGLLLKTESASDSIEGLLSDIDHDIERISHILREFESYAHHSDLKLKRIDVDSIVQEAPILKAQEAKEAEVAFEVGLHPRLSPLEADEEKNEGDARSLER